MDELAYATGIDPVALRLRNDTDADPYSGRPFYARSARMPDKRSGALRLGQAHRRASVDARCALPHRARCGGGNLQPGKARLTLHGNGSALVEAAAHDIDTGAYTAMAQVAADVLGLPLEKVAVRLGDRRLPESHPAIGSATTANATAAVMLAARAAREKAVVLALNGRDAPFAGAAPDDVAVVLRGACHCQRRVSRDGQAYSRPAGHRGEAAVRDTARRLRARRGSSPG
jgi:xanthine dehydrogenase YagR molybdenum-binding subunit